MKNHVIALTMGDPAGIGPEVLLKALKNKQRNSRCSYVLFGSKPVFQKAQSLLSEKIAIQEIQSLRRDQLKAGGVYGVFVEPYLKKNLVNEIPRSKRNFFLKELEGKPHFEKGKISFWNAVLALGSLKCAVQNVLKRKADALVTAPINKTSMRLICKDFHGHTEYLAQMAKARSYAMMFFSSSLRVTLATIHEPLKKVPSLISKKLVYEKIVLTHQVLKQKFKIKKPKIAVCALNPHGRETGLEDDRKILPAVKRAQKKGIQAVGPLSADQLFFEAYQGRYDAVVSMYHDQGLTPFKMIAFRDGVNVTLGLPFIRTSPDHGTAFDIAYRGCADASSMRASIQLAEQLIGA